MKRGFIDWNEREITRSELSKRRDRVLERMEQENLDYLLVYGDVSQCDDVHYLSHFNTYTRDCLLVIGKEGKMSLISSLTLRDREWIANVTPIGEQDIYFSAGLIKTSEVLKMDGFSEGRIGIVGQYFPRVLYKQLTNDFSQTAFVDLSNWFRELRRVKDAAEIRLVKRAALLCEAGAKALDHTAVFEKKENVLSAQAEWIIRARGGEDYHFLCSSGKRGYLDYASDQKVEACFAFSLLAQYKGYWAQVARTVWHAPESDSNASVYDKLVAKVQAEGDVESLEKCIAEAKNLGCVVEIKSPIGTDSGSSIIPGVAMVPSENGAIFTLLFHKGVGTGFFVYCETIHIGEEGYEVWTM